MIYRTLSKGEAIAREVLTPDFRDTCDVLVIGVGSAGSYAALAAAREGAKVIAVEAQRNIGGMSVSGHVSSYYYGFPGGTFEEVERESESRKKLFPRGKYHPDNRLIGLLSRFRNSGIVTLTETRVIGLWCEGNTVSGAAFSDGREVFSIGSKILIDATSDGHAVRMTGVKTALGRSFDGKAVPFCTIHDYVDENGNLKGLNRDCGYCNQYDPEDLSKKILSSHVDTLDRFSSGVGFVSVAPQIGLREGLRFEGEETLSYRDIISGKTWERTLFYAYSDLDKHGHDTALDEEGYQDWWVICNLATVTVRIPVPFGAIVPRNLRGIVTAGRCLSADNYALSAVRMNRDMYRMGECVGIAAAHAVREGCDLLRIDLAAYRAAVDAAGCYAGESDKTFGFDKPNRPGNYRPVDFAMPFPEIVSALASDRPGPAIRSVMLAGEKIIPDLLPALDATDPQLKKNAAIALGAAGEKAALPVLREIVLDRDDYFFLDCRRSNQFRGVVAICLLGRMGDEIDLALLSKIVFDPAEFDRPFYRRLEPDYLWSGALGCHYIFFQYFTHAVAAMKKIAARIGKEESDKLDANLAERLSGESFDTLLSQISTRDGVSNPVLAAEFSDFCKIILA